MDGHKSKIPTIKRLILSKEEKKKEDNIKSITKNIINIGMIGNYKSIRTSWN